MKTILRTHCLARVALMVVFFAGPAATAHGQLLNRLVRDSALARRRLPSFLRRR